MYAHALLFFVLLQECGSMGHVVGDDPDQQSVQHYRNASFISVYPSFHHDCKLGDNRRLVSDSMPNAM
jgi:hypothetical protein